MTGLETPAESTGRVRRLVAVLCADIVSYSRRMGKDEEGTHARVQSLLRDTVNPAVTEHRGRSIKNRGDGFLAMFDSPLEGGGCLPDGCWAGRLGHMARDPFGRRASDRASPCPTDTN